MAYSKQLPHITLADAMNDLDPLFPDTCRCGGCQAYDVREGTRETPQATIAVKSKRVGARAKRRALPTKQIDVLTERAARKYG